MSDPILSLSNLDAHYGDFQALYGVNMDIHAGEVVAIIGANGARYCASGRGQGQGSGACSAC